MPPGHHQHHSSSGSGKGLERAIAVGMDLVKQAREVARANSAPATRERQMAAEHRAALVRHELELRKHKGRVEGARAGAVAGGSGVAIAAMVATQAQAPVEFLIMGGLAAGSAALGWRAHRRAKVLQAHPPLPVLPPLPPARLRPGARGADQADRVANALMHLYDLVPNVGRLYPQAGQELWRAVSDVEPLLRGQVERLASLDRIEWEMPGSRAAQAAVDAGTEITGRLRAGADALEELMAAAVRMLAAPDIGEGVPDALAPAILSLEAFTHGLNAVNAARLGNG
jgi:hypothetical protein